MSEAQYIETHDDKATRIALALSNDREYLLLVELLRMNREQLEYITTHPRTDYVQGPVYIREQIRRIESQIAELRAAYE